MYKIPGEESDWLCLDHMFTLQTNHYGQKMVNPEQIFLVTSPTHGLERGILRLIDHPKSYGMWEKWLYSENGAPLSERVKSYTWKTETIGAHCHFKNFYYKK